MPNIAAIILGENVDNELNKKCLESVSWCSEVINVNTKNNGSFSDWRNEGARKAKSEWLLYVDTDEIITVELKKSIINCITSNKYSAYAIPRRNFIFGHEMKYCGLWPDYVLRLIRKDKLKKWQGDLHEQPIIDGGVSHLSEALIHNKHNNLSDMVDKTNKWSEVEAKLMFDAGHPRMNFFRFFTAGLREFWLRMIIQTAFMDGIYGVIYGLYQVFSRLVSYSKLWELQLRSENIYYESSNI